MKANVFQNSRNFCKFCSDGYQCIRIVLLVLILCSGEVSPAFDKLETGAEPLGLGNAIVAMTGTAYAIYYNPAAIRRSGSVNVALTYQSFYGIKDLGQADIIINFSIAGQPLSFAVSRFGQRFYNEWQGSFGTSYDLGNQCSIGVGLHLYHLSISGYGHQTAWGINMGFIYQLFPAFTLGTYITNLNKPTLSPEGEILPQVLTIGVKYEPLETMQVLMAIYRDLHFAADFRGGFSYQPIEQFVFRCGIEDASDTICFGFGVTVNRYLFDYALKIHRQLGLSHTASLNIIL